MPSSAWNVLPKFTPGSWWCILTIQLSRLLPLKIGIHSFWAFLVVAVQDASRITSPASFILTVIKSLYFCGRRHDRLLEYAGKSLPDDLSVADDKSIRCVRKVKTRCFRLPKDVSNIFYDDRFIQCECGGVLRKGLKGIHKIIPDLFKPVVRRVGCHQYGFFCVVLHGFFQIIVLKGSPVVVEHFFRFFFTDSLISLLVVLHVLHAGRCEQEKK